MARNGSGTFSLVSGNPVTTGATISSTWANNTLSDIATALTGSIAADGQTPITANLPMSNYKHTGAGSASASGQYLVYAQSAAALADLTLSGALNVTGTQTNTGALNLSGTTTATGAVNLSGTTTATGAVNLSGTSTIAAAGTLNVSGTMAVVDTALTFVDGGDTTKKVAFQVSGITTGTTRTATWPDKSGTVAMTSDIPASGITLGTPQASTSGTNIDFTGIPAGTKRVVINFVGVSTGGSSNYLVQIGDSGGVETSGYIGGAATTGGNTSNTTGFLVTSTNISSSSTLYGSVRLELENSSNNTWCSSGNLQDGSVFAASAGGKSLSAALDRVRITTVSGDTFDAGEINISYE